MERWSPDDEKKLDYSRERFPHVFKRKLGRCSFCIPSANKLTVVRRSKSEDLEGFLQRIRPSSPVAGAYYFDCHGITSRYK